MRPGDHPEFFRLPAPEGRSRESTIRLDARGRFFHDDQLVDHPKLRRALATWISRHPDDGRYILSNGYDWTYFVVEDVPFFVRSVTPQAARMGTPGLGSEPGLELALSDGSTEPLRVEELALTEDGNVRTRVKHAAFGGPFDAKFTGAALVELAPFLEASGDGSFKLFGRTLPSDARPSRPASAHKA